MIDFTRETPDEVKERLLGEMTELKKGGEDLLALASANSPRHAEINNLLSFFEVNKEFILSVDFANLTDDDKKEQSLRKWHKIQLTLDVPGTSQMNN